MKRAEILKRVGSYRRQFRNHFGISVTDVARCAGLQTTNSVYKFEQGKVDSFIIYAAYEMAVQEKGGELNERFRLPDNDTD